MTEVWKTATTRGITFDRYMVSSNGRIKSLIQSNGIKDKSGLMSPCLRDGYPQVGLVAPDGSCKTVRVHCVVAETFLGQRHAGFFVNHKDGNKKNNDISNLEWVTSKENTRHALENLDLARRAAVSRTVNGTRGRKLSFSKAQEIREDARSGRSFREIAKSFGIHETTVKDIIDCKYWNPVHLSDDDLSAFVHECENEVLKAEAELHCLHDAIASILAGLGKTHEKFNRLHTIAIARLNKSDRSGGIERGRHGGGR